MSPWTLGPIPVSLFNSHWASTQPLFILLSQLPLNLGLWVLTRSSSNPPLLRVTSISPTPRCRFTALCPPPLLQQMLLFLFSPPPTNSVSREKLSLPCLSIKFLSKFWLPPQDPTPWTNWTSWSRLSLPSRHPPPSPFFFFYSSSFF